MTNQRPQVTHRHPPCQTCLVSWIPTPEPSSSDPFTVAPLLPVTTQVQRVKVGSTLCWSIVIDVQENKTKEGPSFLRPSTTFVPVDTYLKTVVDLGVEEVFCSWDGPWRPSVDRTVARPPEGVRRWFGLFQLWSGQQGFLPRVLQPHFDILVPLSTTTLVSLVDTPPVP